MRRLALAAVCTGLWAAPAWAQTNITTPTAAIVVTFAETRAPGTGYGTYVNGDYWIVGPVTISDRNPKDTIADGIEVHGCDSNIDPPDSTSVNQAHSQGVVHGLDRRPSGNFYVPAEDLCRTLPSASIPAGSSVLFAKSKPIGGCAVESQQQGCIEAVDVITVVSSAPAANSFRPPYAGTNKAITFTLANVRYTGLKSLAPVTGQPTIATLLSAGLFRAPFLILSMGTQNWERFVPTSGNNTPYGSPYGRVVNNGIGDAILGLHRSDSNAVKEPLAIRVVQAGIDIYGQYLAGERWTGAAGFCTEGQALLLQAASMLNNQAMMDAGSSALHPQQWCADQRFKYLSQGEVDLVRRFDCGDNVADTVETQCASFTKEMIGRPMHCDGLWWNGPTACTAGPGGTSPSGAAATSQPSYSYMMNSLVAVVLGLRLSGLEQEVGWPAMFDYILSRPGNGTPWFDLRWTQARINIPWWNDCAAANHVNSNGLRQYLCNYFTAYATTTPADGSISPGGPPNQAPTVTIISPSASVQQTTTAATLALGIGCSDVDGTCASQAAVADCDATTPNTGTAASAVYTVDLPPARASCRVLVQATDNVGTLSAPLEILILRQAGIACTLADTFALAGNGTWPAPPPDCWTRMSGDVLWKNNRLEAEVGARNFTMLNTTLGNDQQLTVSLPVAPVSGGAWAYAGVRGSVSGSTYSGIGCTAEVPNSFIASFVNGNRVPMLAIAGVPWAATDTLGCSGVGQQYCLLRNGTSVGCTTDANALFTGGKLWTGVWGAGMAVDNASGQDLTGAPMDQTPPSADFTVPAVGPIVITTQPYTLAQGVASDLGSGAGACAWLVVEYPAVNGACGGTWAAWTVPSMAASTGNNTLQVTVTDAAGNPTVISRVIQYQPGSLGSISFGTVNGQPPTGDTFTQTGSPVLQVTGTTTACDTLRVTGGLGDHIVGGPYIEDATPGTYDYRIRLAKGTNVLVFDCYITGAVDNSRPLTVTFPGLPVR